MDGGTGEMDMVEIDRTAATLGITFTVNGAAGSDGTRAVNFDQMFYHAGSGDDVITGAAGYNSLEGNAGNDRLTGGNSSGVGDDLHGGDGNDVLRGGGEGDYLDGGNGFDIVMYSESTAGVAINLAAGTGVGGTAQDDTLLSIEGAYGGAGNDSLQGSNGDNTLVGNDGNDVLAGLAGKDALAGGAGADRFTYGSVGQSLVGAASDLITDFSHAQGDRVDLGGIDANTVLAGNQAFAFIGTAAFSHVAGQLREVIAGGVTSLYGDVNGDGAADFQIRCTGAITFVAADFVL
jgi:Ca2+-binding RTX toxin-like protein